MLDEVGIDRDIAMREAMRFAPPVIAMLQRKKLLEPILRRQLQGFYSSSAVASILGANPEKPAAVKKSARKTTDKESAKAAKAKNPAMAKTVVVKKESTESITPTPAARKSGKRKSTAAKTDAETGNKNEKKAAE